MSAEAVKNIETEDTEAFDKARESAKEAYENFLQAKKHLQNAAKNAGVDLRESANEYMEEAVDTVNSKSRQAYRDAEAYARKHPAKSAGLAFLAGFIASKIIR